jgi:hypothetical protein
MSPQQAIVGKPWRVPLACAVFAPGWTRRGVSSMAQKLGSTGLLLSHPSSPFVTGSSPTSRGNTPQRRTPGAKPRTLISAGPIDGGQVNATPGVCIRIFPTWNATRSKGWDADGRTMGDGLGDGAGRAFLGSGPRVRSTVRDKTSVLAELFAQGLDHLSPGGFG